MSSTLRWRLLTRVEVACRSPARGSAPREGPERSGGGGRRAPAPASARSGPSSPPATPRCNVAGRARTAPSQINRAGRRAPSGKQGRGISFRARGRRDIIEHAFARCASRCCSSRASPSLTWAGIDRGEPDGAAWFERDIVPARGAGRQRRRRAIGRTCASASGSELQRAPAGHQPRRADHGRGRVHERSDAGRPHTRVPGPLRLPRARRTA